MEKEAGEGGEVQSRYRLWQYLVVLGQPPEVGCPREGTLHDATARQKYEALLGAGVFGHFAQVVDALGAS